MFVNSTLTLLDLQMERIVEILCPRCGKLIKGLTFPTKVRSMPIENKISAANSILFSPMPLTSNILPNFLLKVHPKTKAITHMK